MTKNGKTFVLLALCSMVAACADQLALNIHCTPRGAEILADGKVVGTCPVTIYQAIGEEDKKRGIVPVKAMTARWLSGASAAIPAMTVELKRGYSREIAVTRPEGYPGIDADMKRARELEEEEARRKEAEALRSGGNGGGGGY